MESHEDPRKVSTFFYIGMYTLNFDAEVELYLFEGLAFTPDVDQCETESSMESRLGEDER